MRATRNKCFADRPASALLLGPVALLTLLPVWSAACDETYPLDATFCDDWCRATRIEGCGSRPSSCVRNCELTKSDSDCFSKQEELLRCYEGADHDAFVCLDNRRTRVAPEVCQGERDSLFECEAPGIGRCLELCRDAQAEALDRVADAETGTLDLAKLIPEAGAPDAGFADRCPALDGPCETTCWNLFAFTSAGLVAAGLDPDDLDRSIERALADSGVMASGEECVELVFSGCYLGQPNDGGVEDADAGEADEDAGAPGQDGGAEDAGPGDEDASVTPHEDLVDLCLGR